MPPQPFSFNQHYKKTEKAKKQHMFQFIFNAGVINDTVEYNKSISRLTYLVVYF